MTRTAMRLAFVGMLSLAFASGCCPMERRLRPSRGVKPPVWVNGPFALNENMRSYVGIAVTENVLTEAEGRRRALKDAAEQVVRNIEMDVATILKRTEVRDGPIYKPGGHIYSRVYDHARAMAQNVLLGMQPVEYYWEKWELRESWCVTSFRRYKHFMLAEFPESEYRRLLKEAAAKTRDTE